jgi:hypothetical protein
MVLQMGITLHLISCQVQNNMEVVRVFANLKYNGLILDRNFKYQIIKYLGNFNEVSTFRIQKDYYKANEITISKDGKIIFEMSTDGSSFTTVFNGVVSECKESENFFIVEAENNVSMKEIIQETFEDTKLSEILNKLAENDLHISDIDFKRIVLNSTKRDALKQILKTASDYSGSKIYNYYNEGKIIITNSLSGTTYKVDDYTIEKVGQYLTIFPIPTLILADSLTYKNKSYNINALIIEDNRMLCEIEAAS